VEKAEETEKAEERVEGPAVAARLADWVRQLSSLHGDPFLGLEGEERGPVPRAGLVRTDPFHGLRWETREQWGVEGWEGGLDGEGRWAGQGMARLPGGGEAAGIWRPGGREGRGSSSAPAQGVLALNGTYRAGRLAGLGKLLREDGTSLEGHFRL
jgi:hypothetical protein